MFLVIVVMYDQNTKYRDSRPRHCRGRCIRRSYCQSQLTVMLKLANPAVISSYISYDALDQKVKQYATRILLI